MDYIKLEILGDKYEVTSVSRDDEEVTVTAIKKSHFLNEAYIIGAKEIVRKIQEDLDELYTERDNISSRISEKERDLEFYNKKIKEFSGD